MASRPEATTLTTNAKGATESAPQWVEVLVEPTLLESSCLLLRLARLLHDGQIHVALLHHLSRYLELFDPLLAGEGVHEIEHQLFQDHAQSARTDLPQHRLFRDAAQRFIGKAQLHVLELEESLILLYDGVLRLGKNLDERVFVQVAQYANHGQTSDELRNQ